MVMLNMTSSNQRKLGWFLLITPIPGLMLTLALYAIVSFVVSSIAVGADAPVLVGIGALINVLLGFLGILCVLGILIGMPVGLILLMTAKSEPVQEQNTEQLKKVS